MDLKKAMKTYQAVVVKAQKEKEDVEGQFVILESDKTTLNKALEEANVARDETIAMVDSLKFKQERLVRVAKQEAKEKVVRAIFEKEKAVKALKEERADEKAIEATIRKEAKEKAVGDILK